VIDEEDNGKIRFYYSREHRLSRASRQVREMNEQRPVRRRGLFSSLAPTKAHGIMLISILMACAMVLIATRVSRGPPALILGGCSLRLELRREGEGLGLSMGKKAPPQGGYTGPVDIAVSPEAAKDGGTLPEVFTARIYWTDAEEERFSISLPPEAVVPGTRRYLLMVQIPQELLSRRVEVR